MGSYSTGGWRPDFGAWSLDELSVLFYLQIVVVLRVGIWLVQRLAHWDVPKSSPPQDAELRASAIVGFYRGQAIAALEPLFWLWLLHSLFDLIHPDDPERSHQALSVASALVLSISMLVSVSLRLWKETLPAGLTVFYADRRLLLTDTVGLFAALNYALLHIP